MADNEVWVKLRMPYKDYKTYVKHLENHVFDGKYDQDEKEALRLALKDNPEYQSLKETVRECYDEMKKIELDEWERLVFDRESDEDSK